MLKLNNIGAPKGANRDKKRRGRGSASGQGKSGGRGTKGQRVEAVRVNDRADVGA